MLSLRVIVSVTIPILYGGKGDSVSNNTYSI